MSWQRSVTAAGAVLVAAALVVVLASEHPQPGRRDRPAAGAADRLGELELSRVAGAASPPTTTVFAVGPDVAAPASAPAGPDGSLGAGEGAPRLGASVSAPAGRCGSGSPRTPARPAWWSRRSALRRPG